MRGRCVSHLLCAVVFSTAVLISSAFSQNKTPQQQPSDDVIRVNTELVQTDVTVVDKRGRLIDNLAADQFELLVDDKPQPIALFDRITAGSHTETKLDDEVSRGVHHLTSGRIILFFVDDQHLAPDSLVRTRKALSDFINRGVVKNDLIAITSSSGQIGFLQQFTDDRDVLQMAIARLNYRGNTRSDMDDPPMSEYMALKINDGDESAISYYVAQMMKQNCVKVGVETICMMDTHAARNLVQLRARQITTQNVPETTNTLLMLQGLIRTAAQLPGRKVLFLMSDGFYLNDKQTGSRERIKKITDAAGRAGVVVYTMDARGLINESLDVTNARPSESEGLTVASTIGEISASQDGLNALARDTGGEAFRNTNKPMAEWIDQILVETSTYYLLAWRPGSDEQKKRMFDHLTVRIKDRPDLVVRLRRGYFKSAPLPILTVSNKHDKNAEKAHEDDMRVLIDSPLPVNEIATELSTDIYQTPGIGTRVVASIKMDREGLTFDTSEGKQAADVDIGGILYDDKGKPKTSFVGRLRILGDPSGAHTPAVYRFQSWLTPGLYQLRVGIRDVRTGRSASAMKWIRVDAAN
jgi:VWFA-related protein